MRIDIITLFPEMFNALQYGIPDRAQKKGLLELTFWNPRDFTQDPHRTVDDRPYGGGPGMVMKVEPLQTAIHCAQQASKEPAKISFLSPQGQLFDQLAAQQLAQRNRLILVMGRYEGVDERLIQTEIDEEWSLGDFILSGGELAAMCMIDAIIRLIPGVLGDADSAVQESFSTGLLDYPHYTRPEKIADLTVPEVLLSGNHENIRRWRLKQALGRTWLRRADLLQKYSLTAEEQVLLAEFIKEHLELSHESSHQGG